MRVVKKLCILSACVMCALSMAACGEDETLNAYQEDMNAFFEHIANYNDSMNAIDPSAEDAREQLLSYLDGLQEEITWMAQLETPEQFSAADGLADEADENMRQAVALYHQAYESETFDEGAAEAAREYYDRANLRIQYIIMILHGEIPEGEGITYTEENEILGGGYLNQTQEDEEENAGEGEDSGEEEAPEDDFDTDDTVFYEEPAEDGSQESAQ